MVESFGVWISINRKYNLLELNHIIKCSGSWHILGVNFRNKTFLSQINLIYRKNQTNLIKLSVSE